MKNIYKFFFLFILIFFSIIFFFYFDQVTAFIFSVFTNLQILKNENFFYFVCLLVLYNFIHMLTPIPITPLIVFNGFILESWGFVLSICLIILCSSILFSISKNNNPFFFQDVINNYKNKIFLLKKESSILLLIFISRYIIPYFFHNILFGLFYKKLKYFIFLSVLAEIPVIFALNNFGKHLSSFTESYDLDKLLNMELLLSVVLFLFIAIFVSLLNKKFKF